VDHIVVAVGIAMAVVFGTGVMLGIILMIVMAIRREDSRYTLTGQPPERREPSPQAPRADWPYLGEPDPDDEGPGQPPWRQDRGGR